MLTSLLKREDCAKCKICCSFDSYDLWETPVITDELVKVIEKSIPEKIEYIELNGLRLLKLCREPDEDLYYCSLLDKATGCRLKENKPFECRIWPFRIMKLDNSQRVITISPVCPVMFCKPLSDVFELASALAPKIFSQAEITPEIVKPYLQGYPILVTDKKERQ